MKKERNELWEFVIGLAMLVVGLYLFMQKVTVSSSFFNGGFRLGSVNVSAGLVVVPLIIGIIMVFVKPESFLSKLVAGLGLLLIIVSIIASTTMRLVSVSLYEWILFLVLIFGGLALVCKILFKAPSNKDKK